MFGLIIDLAGLLNELSLSTLIFQLIDLCIVLYSFFVLGKKQ